MVSTVEGLQKNNFHKNAIKVTRRNIIHFHESTIYEIKKKQIKIPNECRKVENKLLNFVKCIFPNAFISIVLTENFKFVPRVKFNYIRQSVAKKIRSVGKDV